MTNTELDLCERNSSVIKSNVSTKGPRNLSEQLYFAHANEWKLMIAVYVSVLFSSTLFFICVAFPLNLAAFIGNKVQWLSTHPTFVELMILCVSITLTMPIVSYISIPWTINMLRFWIFDRVIAFSNQQISDDSSDSIVTMRTEKDSQHSCVKHLLSKARNVAVFGFIALPKKVYTKSEEYQISPCKWKFMVSFWLAVILVECFLWLVLYNTLLSQCSLLHFTDTSPSQKYDARLRFFFYMAVNLCVSIPIVQYVVAPLFTKILFVQWLYGKRDIYADNICTILVKKIVVFSRRGFSGLENIDTEEIISRNLQKQNQKRNVLSVL